MEAQHHLKVPQISGGVDPAGYFILCSESVFQNESLK